MAVARLSRVNPRPEIVLPPGFSLRIDYDPAGSPTSLVVTAFKDERAVGQARLDPREVGLRLRLDVERLEPLYDGPAPREPRLRLTPRGSARAIEMERVEREVGVASSRDGRVEPASEIAPAEPPRTVAPAEPPREVGSTAPEGLGSGIGDALRSLAERAAELLSGPLRLGVSESEGWASWPASWGAIPPPSIAGDG